LNRAVDWGLIDFSPAKRGIRNAPRRPREKRAFDSWAQVEALAARLGPIYGPMITFGVATGLRPSEPFALEQHDVDRELGVVYVRRAYANGRLKPTKTRLSNRAVPLQAKAIEALDRLPPSDNPILFPNARGPHRFPCLRPPPLETRPGSRRDRAGPRPLRHAPRLHHLRASRRRPRLRRLPVHRLEHRDDRPALRRPRKRQPPT
jgi:integrase